MNVSISAPTLMVVTLVPAFKVTSLLITTDPVPVSDSIHL